MDPYETLESNGEVSDEEDDDDAESLRSSRGHLLSADGYSQERLSWLADEAPLARRISLSKLSGVSPAPFHALPEAQLPRNGIGMHRERATSRYLEVCDRYSLQPNGGALLGLSLGLDIIEVDGLISNLDLVPLCAALLDAKFATGLKLSNQPIQDTGASVLALSLPGCPWITSIEVEKCKITGRGAKALAEAVPHSGLTSISLRGNQLRHHAIQGNAALAHIVSRVKRLERLDLQSSGLSSSGMRQIKQAMRERAAKDLPVCSIDFEGNFVIVEVCNSVTHGICALISIEAWRELNTLIIQLCHLESRAALTAYAICMLVMFVGSTLYHSMFVLTELSWFFKVVDHVAIYFLIAGTYTPVLVMGCRDPDSFHVLAGARMMAGLYWTVVLIGVIIELNAGTSARKPDWYAKFILFMYLFLAFGGVPYISSCTFVATADVMTWIEIGGLTYMTGLIFFLLDRRYPAMHIVWHLFVGAGAAFHFYGVWNLSSDIINKRHEACHPTFANDSTSLL